MKTALLLPLLLVPALASAQGPILDVAPVRLSFIAVAGSRGPGPQQLSIRNVGGGSVTWQAVPGAPWISVSPSTGPVPGSATVSVDASRLSAGSHAGRVTVSAVGGSGVVPVVVEVSVQIAVRKVAEPAVRTTPGTVGSQQPAPARGLDLTKGGSSSAPSLDLSAPGGATQPVESVVTVDSPSTGPIEWFAKSDRTWLTVEPTTGMTPMRLTVRASPGGLGAGVHKALLRFVDDARDPMLEVPVTFTIGEPAGTAAVPAPSPAAPAARPSAGAATEAPGAPGPAPLSVLIDMLPPATRNLPYAQVIPITGGRPPYVVRLAKGRLPLGLTMADGAISGVTRFPGTYVLDLVVSDSSSPPQSTAKRVTLPVIIAYQNTALSVTPTTVSLTASAGQWSRGIAIGVASGSFPLGWTAASDKAWLLVSPAQGTAPSVLQLGVDATALEPGAHVATLTVTMEGAANSPMRIPVRVTVRR